MTVGPELFGSDELKKPSIDTTRHTPNVFIGIDFKRDVIFKHLST